MRREAFATYCEPGFRLLVVYEPNLHACALHTRSKPTHSLFPHVNSDTPRADVKNVYIYKQHNVQCST